MSIATIGTAPLSRFFALLMVSVWGFALGAAEPSAKPEGRPANDGAIPIVLDAPNSLDAFLAKIQSPDYVLLRGDRYQNLLKASASNASKPSSDPAISRLTVGGTAGASTADLMIEVELTLDDPAPRWISLKLDGLPLTLVREGERILPVRNQAGRDWEAEVSGVGRHVIEIALSTRVVSSGEERRIELSIPVAATTNLRLGFSEKPLEVLLGGREPLVTTTSPAKSGVRLDSSITPRSRLDLAWRVPLDRNNAVQPLLSAHGEIAVEVTTDAIRSRARWSITAIRGSARSLSFTLDRDEDLIDADLDNEPVATDTIVEGQKRLFTIPLAEPIRSMSPSKSVVLTTRRKLTANQTNRFTIKGYSLEHATLQVGAIAISQTGNLWTEGIAGRGVERIELEELPNELRGRPNTIFGYRFVDPSFDLSLKVEPSPPLFDSRGKTTMIVTDRQVTTNSEFQFRTTPGQIFDIKFRIPRGVDLQPLLINEIVQSWNLITEADPSNPASQSGNRILSIRLTPQAHQNGNFTIKLTGRQSLTPAPGSALGLIQPLQSTSLGGQLAIYKSVDLGIDLASTLAARQNAGFFRAGVLSSETSATPPSDLPTGVDKTPIKLTYEGSPESFALSIGRRARSIRSDVELNAKVSRSRIDYIELFQIEAVNGFLNDLMIIIPKMVTNDWQTESSEIASRELIETKPDGSRLYRLALTKSTLRSLTLRLKYQVEVNLDLAKEKSQPGEFQRIKLVNEADGTVRLSYETAPGIRLEVDSQGWSPELVSEAKLTAGEPVVGGLALRATQADPLPTFQIRADALLELPSLLIAATHLRTIVGNDETRVIATYRIDVHKSDLVITLPLESRLIQARLNQQAINDIEEASDRPGYRIRFSSNDAAVLTLEYALPAISTSAWIPPAIEGAVWQTIYWTVELPATTALLGVPREWSDQNEWFWESFYWKRRPSISSADLRRWLVASLNLKEKESDNLQVLTSSHSYLFRRIDGPKPLSVSLVSRITLLGVCSGVIGLVGILLVLLRPVVRIVVIPIAALGVLVSIGWDPNVTFQVLQSGIVGVALAVIAAYLQRLVDRRNPASPILSERSATATNLPQLQVSTSLIAPPKPDESTTIRRRPLASGSADQILIAPPPLPTAELKAESTEPETGPHP
jgi:hypothetical protein